jgi:type 1 glutamine amidotransferase
LKPAKNTFKIRFALMNFGSRQIVISGKNRRQKMKTYPFGKHIVTLLSTVAVSAVVLFSGCSSTCHAESKPKHVLVVTTTTGFRHSSIATAEKIIAELAQRNGKFTVEFASAETGGAEFKGADGKPDNTKIKPVVAKVLAEKMSAEAMKKYDAVIFANTTGDLPMPDPQAFVDWVKSGKGFVGIHSATDTFHGFRPFIEMIGGEFKTHGPQVEVEPIVQDKDFPACRHIPAGWKIFDEIYQLKSFERTNVHGLLTLDKLATGKDPNAKTQGDFPVAWSKEFGKGRVFYTSLGHREDVWEPNSAAQKSGIKNPAEVAQVFQQHILSGILWALGLEKGDAKPDSPE